MIVLFSSVAAVRTSVALGSHGLQDCGREFWGRFRFRFASDVPDCRPLHVSPVDHQSLVSQTTVISKSFRIVRHLFPVMMYLLISSRAVTRPSNNEIDIPPMRNGGSR